MKQTNTCFLILSILLTHFVGALAQTRGVGNVKITDSTGKIREVKLYDGSYALIIGESNYTNGWDTLNGVKSDVADVKRVLEKDFTVEVEMNLKSDALKTRIDRFISDYGYSENNRLLIYFAGHGHTAKSLDGRDLGYIIPVDTPLPDKDALGFKRKAIPMDTIQDYARRIEAKHALFVFDSCFSGKLISREAMVVPPVIREDVTYPVRQFITAGAANQPVPDDSIFRKVFVRGLEGEADLNRDGYITGTELASFLKDKVTNATDRAQTPQYGKIRDIDLERGDFVFAGQNVATPTYNVVNNIPTNEPVPSIVIDANVGEKEITNTIGMKFIKILGKSFYMGKFEVTQAQWESVMKLNPSQSRGCAECPVERVSWYDVKAFIVQLNLKEGKEIYRLPFQEEREYVMKGGVETTFFWGNSASQADDYAWYQSNSGGTTHPVGQKKPDKYGLYDMAGNVWEWCEDGNDSSSKRVNRGGGWNYSTEGLSSSFFFNIAPNNRQPWIGFRLIKLK